MNSDEFFCNSIDQKVHSMEEHVRNYFQSRFTFHLNKEKSDK
ncbi:hypothetical protein yrohd0001_22540 [Yersinia rohdei ATCC 43380]|nr:hypothetical protein yrohd0001_22540 [Yersinia rohdei ATCC 43380]